ncbi:MAG: arginine N-succinyltransferase [Gammaproteobacteria bacterium]|nr:arginine N-succinyltransferase [Gammaproteobacteria bacterium]
MLLQRFCRRQDMGRIQRLVTATKTGTTAVPAAEQRLAELIEGSEAAMLEGVTFSGEERYFFVLEDSDSGELVGCSSIVAAAGFSQPFYTFRNEVFLHASRQLGLHNRIHVLSLCHDLTGHSLLSGLYQLPGQDASVLALNALGRLAFMASHPDRFAESVAVEVAGINDGRNAPFWDAVGRHFFAVSYSEAEQIGLMRGRSFLAELMPGYPIYVPMLSDAAQEVIGQVQPASEAVFELLLEQGFETDNYVDIFDGGPVLHARSNSLRAVAGSQVACADVVAEVTPGRQRWLVSNQQVADYRATVLNVDWQPGHMLPLSADQADLLKVRNGDALRLLEVS